MPPRRLSTSIEESSCSDDAASNADVSTSGSALARKRTSDQRVFVTPHRVLREVYITGSDDRSVSQTIDESQHVLCPMVQHYIDVMKPERDADDHDSGRLRLKIPLLSLCTKVIIRASSKKKRHASNRALHSWTCETLECIICMPLRQPPPPPPPLPPLPPPPSPLHEPVPEPEIRPPSPSPSPSPSPAARKPVSLCFCSQPEDVKHAVEEVLEAASRHSMLAVDTLEMMAEHTDFMKQTFKRMKALHSSASVTSAPVSNKKRTRSSMTRTSTAKKDRSGSETY